MNILYTAFNGKNNSSKILLDKINSNNKLYLKNSFITSVKELEKIILKLKLLEEAKLSLRLILIMIT